MITRRPFVNILASIALVLASLGAQAQCFTTSAPTNNCSWGDQINAFTLNSIPATGNSGCGSSGYNSFSSPVWNLTIGQTYSWSSTVGSGMYPQGFAIWIDVNNNGIYESTEMLASTGYNYSHSGNITIPSGSTAGNNIRMRIRCAYYSSISGTDVCVNGIGYGYGETEDYYVNLVSPCTNPTVPTIGVTNATTCAGGPTTLSIASGTLNSATNWQWYTGSCGGTSAGAGTSITVSPTTTTTYYVRGEGGCVTPGSCAQSTITVTPANAITTQPAATTTLCEGSTLNLSVVASNAAGYQWYNGAGIVNNGGNISGATTANLQITAITTAQAANYYVVVSGNTPCANITSNTAVVNVNAAPAISTQPAANTSLCEGSTLNLSVTSTNGTGYQWYNTSGIINDGGNISGATSANLQITGTTTAQTSSYYVIITGNTPCSNLNSNNAMVTVNAPVNITTPPPATLDACEGSAINIGITATGATGYQWYNSSGPLADGGSISGAMTANLVINPSVAADAGTYYVILNGTTPCPNVTSTNTVVTVNQPVMITSQPPATFTACDGGSINLSTVATNGTGYLWYKDGNPLADGGNISGATTSSLQVTPTTITDAGTYHVEITANAGCNTATSTNTVVSTGTSPVITLQPQATTSCTGIGASFSVGATGTGLMYQWYLGINPLSDNAIYSGTGSNMLTISDVAGLNGNVYHVVVTGNCGTPQTSNTAMLTEDLNNTWDGSTSTAWSDATNWSCGTVPVVTTNVLIPTGAPLMPLVDIPTAICNSIVIDPGASVAFAGTNNALEIKSTITNNSIFDASAGKVILSGTGAQNVPPVTYKNLDISGGSTKTLDGPATVTGILALINGYLQIGPYDLTIDVPVQILGGNATSFIVTNDTGEVIGKNMGLIGGNPDAAMFPVGVNSGSYTPIMLENMGNADDYRVRVMPNVYEDGYGVNPQMVVNPVVDRTWMVSEGTAGGSYVNMNPYWNSVNEINGFTQTHVYVAHYIGGMWISYIDSANGAPAAGTFGSLFYADVDSLQNFSPFTVASSSNNQFPFPLAIKLLDISAMNAGKRNRVNWNTATEAMGDKFEIQRSIDGRTFTAIGNMNANGKPSTYNYWDETPFTGKNYYRLKMTDANGKAAFSNVVSATVKAGSSVFGVKVHPNPVEGGKLTVIVSGDISGEASVVVTDVTGAVVKQKRSLTSNALDIDVSELAQGVYFVKYSDDAHHEIIKVNKQ